MKRKFVCGIALCLVLAVAGCGKDSKEQQAANYYQSELGMDKDEAEELAHELYGNNDEDTDIVEEESGEIVVEPLPEFLNSEWYEQKVQIYDMVFSNDMYLTEEDIRRIVAGSAYDVEIKEDFDSDGNIVPRGLIIDGRAVVTFWKNTRGGNIYGEVNDMVKYGLLEDGAYFGLGYGDLYGDDNWYDKSKTEFVDLETRDDVLAYLAANGFVEVEQQQAVYLGTSKSIEERVEPDNIPEGFEDIANTPHYYCEGVQRVTLYRIHKLGETDQEVERGWYRRYSGAHLNLVNCVTFTFNTDGTVERMDYETDKSIVYGERL